MSKKTEKNIELLEKITKKLFSLLGTNSSFRVEEDDENEAFLIKIDSEEEAGLIIGSRGETLASIQTILGMIYRQRTGIWKRIIVDVRDWRQKQEERLQRLAKQTAERVITSGEPQSLYNLTPAQRRHVHMVLKEEEGIETESFGEGNERYLVVKLSDKKTKK